MLIPFDYLVSKYSLKINSVGHFGGNRGQEAEAYNAMGVNNVYWVEAIPSVFEDLKKHLEQFHNQIAMLACLSNENGKEVSFNISNNEAQSSSFLELGTHKQQHPEVSYIEQIKLTTTRADTFFNIMEFDSFSLDLVNIDVQGAELLVLEGMGKLLGKVKYFYLEVNREETYVGCPLIEDIDYFLLQHDFQRVELQWASENLGWGDAFYIRRDLL